MLGPEEMREYEEHMERHETSEPHARPVTAPVPLASAAPALRLLRVVFPFAPRATRR